MLEKILDRYYAKKLIKELMIGLMPHHLEYYYVINKDTIDIYANYVEEYRKFKQEKKIYSIKIKEAFIKMFRTTEIIKDIQNRIDITFK